jgi:zinc protease
VTVPPGDQAHLFLGHLTVERVDDDLPALELLSIVLGAGSGLAGRIPTRIRERDGLAYTATAAAASGAGLDRGRLVAYLATAPENAERAEVAVVEELRRLRQDGVTDAEIAEGRSYLLGREPFRRETPRQWAELLAEAELYGLPVDRADWVLERYAGLDRAAVEGALERNVDVEELRVTVGMPASS